MDDLETKITEFFDHAVDQYQNLLDQSIDPETDVTDKLFIKTRLDVWYEVVNKLSDALPFLTDPDHITVPVTPGTFPEDNTLYLEMFLDEKTFFDIEGVAHDVNVLYYAVGERVAHIYVVTTKDCPCIDQIVEEIQKENPEMLVTPLPFGKW